MRRWILLIVLLGLAFWGADSGELRELVPTELTPQLSRGFLLFVFLLAWRFRRGRVALVTLMLAALLEGARVSSWALGSKTSDVLTVQDLSLFAGLMMLNLVWIAWSRDWPVLSGASLVRLGIVGAQGLAGWMFLRSEKAEIWMSAVSEPWRLEALSLTLPLPKILMILFIAVALILVWQTLRTQATPLDVGWLGILLLLFFALIDVDHWSYFLSVGTVLLGLMMIEQVFSLAFEDGLTRLPARRALEEALPHLGRTYAIAMVDIDHFKKINDRHGHEVGDQVLRLISTRLARVGGGGRAYRYGGEEFCLLFPGRSAAEAEDHLEALRKSIAERPFAIRSVERPKRKPKNGKKGGGSDRSLKVTVSMGVAQKNAKLSQPSQVMKAADKALYRAKRGGRNRVVLAR